MFGTMSHSQLTSFLSDYIVRRLNEEEDLDVSADLNLTHISIWADFLDSMQIIPGGCSGINHNIPPLISLTDEQLSETVDGSILGHLCQAQGPTIDIDAIFDSFYVHYRDEVLMTAAIPQGNAQFNMERAAEFLVLTKWAWDKYRQEHGLSICAPVQKVPNQQQQNGLVIQAPAQEVTNQKQTQRTHHRMLFVFKSICIIALYVFGAFLLSTGIIACGFIIMIIFGDPPVNLESIAGYWILIISSGAMFLGSILFIGSFICCCKLWARHAGAADSYGYVHRLMQHTLHTNAV